MDLGPPSFYQEVVSDFIREGHFARHIRRMRVHYGELRSALVVSLSRELGPLVELLGDQAGMHVAVTLQNGSCDLEIAERAARLNLSLWPLSPSYMGEASRQGFILGFGGTSDDGDSPCCTQAPQPACHKVRRSRYGRWS